MFAMTACGRDILRTPLSVNWAEFKTEPPQFKCTLCEKSKQAIFNAKKDLEKQA